MAIDTYIPGAAEPGTDCLLACMLRHGQAGLLISYSQIPGENL